MEQINYNLLRNLDEKYGSPFYIMDSDKYRFNLNIFSMLSENDMKRLLLVIPSKLIMYLLCVK